MILSLVVIIASSVGLLTGIIGGGALGYSVGNRRREYEMDENYSNMINYYTNN